MQLLACLTKSGVKLVLHSSLIALSIQDLSSSVIILSLNTRWHSCTHKARRYPSDDVTEAPKAGSSPKGEFFMKRSRDARMTPWKTCRTCIQSEGVALGHVHGCDTCTGMLQMHMSAMLVQHAEAFDQQQRSRIPICVSHMNQKAFYTVCYSAHASEAHLGQLTHVEQVVKLGWCWKHLG